MFAAHTQRLYLSLQEIWFVFFRAPGHKAIIGTPMGEKDIDACPG